jgi:lysozyme
MSERISNPNLPPTDQPERARLRDMLIRHEGRQTHPYRDIFGKITIGIGRNLSDRGLAADEIDLLFANDVAIARAICGDLYGGAFSAATPARQMALISMAFNLGGPRLASFRRMRAAIHHDNWMQDASEARHSRWAKQVGRRSTEIAGILASGVTPNV